MTSEKKRRENLLSDIARYVAPVVVRAIKKKMRGKYETPV